MLSQLAMVWVQICTDQFEALLLHASSLVAFFAALRVSDLVAHSKTDNSWVALQWPNLILEQDHATLVLCKSKTDQAGKD
ncbi:hypothetical protein JRQ81_001994, partial [Phrynocephalus forsythii]